MRMILNWNALNRRLRADTPVWFLPIAGTRVCALGARLGVAGGTFEREPCATVAMRSYAPPGSE